MSTAQTAHTFESLGDRSRDELLDLWRGLPAPDPVEMEGEFSPWVPPYFAVAFRAFQTSQGQDAWYGKAYSKIPYHGSQGQGHNIWQIGPDVVRSLRFAWDIKPSGLDGRPALVMDYPAFDNPAGAWDLIDEVRSLGPGLLLGIYSTAAPAEGFTPVMDPETGRTRHEIFGLQGPVGPWIGPDDQNAESR